MDTSHLLTDIGSLGGVVLAVGTGIAWVIRRVRAFGSKFDTFMDDWQGVQARPGVEAKPGVMERLSSQDKALQHISERVTRVESEVNYNSGKSLKDIAHRTEGSLKHLSGKVNTLEHRVSEIETDINKGDTK